MPRPRRSDDDLVPYLDAGIEVLARDGARAVAEVVNTASVGRRVGKTSKVIGDAFRSPSRDAGVRLARRVVEHLCDMTSSGVRDNIDLGIELYGKALNQHLLDGEWDAEALFELGLLQNFHDTFKGQGFIAGIMVHAAAAAVSEPVQTPPGISPRDKEFARHALRERASFYREMTVAFLPLLTAALEEMGRRPREGQSLESICVAIHALHDGLALRRIIEPESVTPEAAAKTLIALGYALTEPGSIVDERTPEGVGDRQKFARLVRATIDLYRHSSSVTEVEVARRARVARRTADQMFGSYAGLVDSAVRSRVGAFAHAFDIVGPRHAEIFIPRFMHWLYSAAYENPNLFAASRGLRESLDGKSVLSEIAESLARALRDVVKNVTPAAENLIAIAIDSALVGDEGELQKAIAGIGLTPFGSSLEAVAFDADEG